jgi:hypothetical protein
LEFPTNKPVFYKDLPTAGHGTVDAMTGSHAVVIAPSFPVKVFPGTRVLAYAKPFAAVFHDMSFQFICGEII